jgi:hypothetical protein
MRTLSLILAMLLGATAVAQTAGPALAGPLLLAKVTPQYNTYQVRRGDTLFSIAEKFYGTGHGYWQIIADENGVSPDSLQPGMVLKIPINPKLKTPTAAETKSAAPQRKPAEPPEGPTVGETVDAVVKRLGAFTSLLGLTFEDGPTYAFKVVMFLFLACLLYVAADALMVWLCSIMLRAPDPTLGRAGKVSISSAGLQLLLVLGILMLGAVVNQVWPDTASVENLRQLRWYSRGVYWPTLLSAAVAFFFIPFSMTKQTYGVTAGKAGAIIVLAVALKCFIAFFPGAVAFVATGGGVS